MDALLKGVLSGVLVSAVLLLARGGRTEASGLLVLFPVVTLLSYYFIGHSEGEERLRAVVMASLLALPVLVIFMAVAYFALGHVGYRLALLAALMAWAVAGSFFLVLARS